MQKSLSSYGSPNSVSSQDTDSLDNDSRVLSHGKTGSQGGDRGNEYQALWMTLACLNAVHTSQEQPKLVEVILEGEAEPYDDVELRKDDGSFTLFQSKHRDTSGSDNITISELIKLPPKKGGKSQNTAFSLPKYFMGMMKEYTKNTDLSSKRFIICASASFSQKFKNPDDDKQVTLEDNTWSTGGILNTLAANQLDPLFTGVFIRNEQFISLSQKIQKCQPIYATFNDNFIEGQNITENQKILRKLIFKSIKEYIQQKNKENWVTSAMKQSPELFIKLFLRHLQWWIKQPKLEELRDAVVKFSISENFGGHIETIHREFYELMRTSSDRNHKSLGLEDVMNQLRCARGKALSSVLKFSASNYHTSCLLPSITFGKQNKALKSLLDGERRVCIFTSDTEMEDLKYLIYSYLFFSQKNQGKPLENWCLMHAKSKPLYHFHPIHGELDHDIKDIFLSENIDILVIDHADALITTKNGKKQLEALKRQKTTKIILISHKENVSALKNIFDIEVTNRQPIRLSDNELEQILQHEELGEKTVVAQSGKKDRFSLGLLQQSPSICAALRSPYILADFIRDLKPMAARAQPSLALQKFEVPYYIVTPLPLPEPYYDFCSLLKNARCAKLCMRDLSLENQKLFREEFQSTDKIYTSKDGKHLYFHLNTEESNTKTIYLKHEPSLGKMVVSVQNHQLNSDDKPSALSFIPEVSAAGFREEATLSLNSLTDLLSPSKQTHSQTTITTNNLSDLLPKTIAQPLRKLVVADYGTGKSSLIKQLYSSWVDRSFEDQTYDWVVSCHLTQIVQHVQGRVTLVDILLNELVRQQLVSDTPPLWIKKSLEEAIKCGELLILFDRWDELHQQYYEIMSKWIEALPQTVSFLVVTRTHAVPALKVSFHQKIKLPLFSWQQIKNYINQYFQREVCVIGDTSEILDTIYQWLGCGENDSVIDILSRPLHLKLLCDALKPYITCEITGNAPWNESTLYRLKLYQLIMSEQLRRYLNDQIQIAVKPHISAFHSVNLFTQVHQARLRELGFQLVFDAEPIRLFMALDDQELIRDLYNLGILSSTCSDETLPEFQYRIFSEYFSAQYLLNGLMRGQGDFIYDFVIKIIRANASNPRFEEVWRLLGEMIRFGEEFLNYSAKGKETKVLSIYPEITDQDLCGAYFHFFSQCVNGAAPQRNYSFEMSCNNDLYRRSSDYTATVPNEKSELTDEALKSLLIKAKSEKNSAVFVISHLVATKQLTESWLMNFYHKEKNRAETVEEKTLKQNDIYKNLSKLGSLVNTFKWPEEAWGGFWDIDVFLPCIKLMNVRLYITTAAYFIHRVQNKNGAYYDYGLAHSVGEIIEELANADFEDKNSIRNFLIMLITWLKKPNLVNHFIGYIIPGALNQITTMLSTENISDQVLAITALFSLSFAYQLRVSISEKNSMWMVALRSVNNSFVFNHEITQDLARLIKLQFKKIHSQIDPGNYSLPEFALDGSDFVKPEEEAVHANVIDESESTDSTLSL